MNTQNSNQFSKGKISIWTVIILIGVLVVISAEGVLVYQLLQLAKKEMPALKEATEQQAAQYEQQTAQYALDKFLEARIAEQEDQALIYLTENAMEQYSQNEFDLINNFKSFETLKSENFEEIYPASLITGFRFIVRIQQEDELGEIVEAIGIIKISDKYYVDSVEIAG